MRSENDGEALREIPMARMRSVEGRNAVKDVEFQEFPRHEGEAIVTKGIENDGDKDRYDGCSQQEEEEVFSVSLVCLFREEFGQPKRNPGNNRRWSNDDRERG